MEMGLTCFDVLLEMRTRSLVLYGLSDREARLLAACATLKSLPPKTNVFRSGDQIKYVYLLRRGLLRVSQSSENGRSVILSFLRPGQIIGTCGLVSVISYYSVDALEPSEVLIWNALELAKITQQVPQLLWNLFNHVSSWIPGFCDRYRELLSDNVERRIARALLRLANDDGQEQTKVLRIEVPLSLEDFAGYCGATLFTVSRVLKGLERKRVISRNRRQVLLRDLRILRQLSGAHCGVPVPQPKVPSNNINRVLNPHFSS
jgi:CRP/FNR family transcriptional regulator, nitrogen oxide reductase regulator